MATLRNLRQDARGFTLTEIMVTLVIFSIVVAISFPMLVEANRTHQLLSAASRIESALMRARSTAVTQQTPVRVSFNGATNTLLLAQDTNRDGNLDTQMRTIIINGNYTFSSQQQYIFFQQRSCSSYSTCIGTQREGQAIHI